MVQRTLNDALAGHKDERVVLRGWVHRRSRLSAVTFLVLRDRSGLAQIVVTSRDQAQLDSSARRPSSRSKARSPPTTGAGRPEITEPRSARCPTRPRHRRWSCGARL